MANLSNTNWNWSTQKKPSHKVNVQTPHRQNWDQDRPWVASAWGTSFVFLIKNNLLKLAQDTQCLIQYCLYIFFLEQLCGTNEIRHLQINYCVVSGIKYGQLPVMVMESVSGNFWLVIDWIKQLELTAFQRIAMLDGDNKHRMHWSCSRQPRIWWEAMKSITLRLDHTTKS